MDAMYTNRDLNRFWLHILADNALVIYNSLSPAETEAVSRAKISADRFDALAELAEKTDADQEVLNKDAFQAAQDLRKFFVYILGRKISDNFHLDLKATAVNSFARETEKYMATLDDFMHNRIPAYNPIDEEVFWLLLFTNQSRYIADNLGDFQKRYKDKAQELANVLNQYWSFSIELKKIVSRVGDKYTRLADEHHLAVSDVVLELYEFVSTLILLQRESSIPGSLSMLYLDRVRRMTCFYLQQWAKSINSTAPDCNPFAKRISAY